MPSTSTRRPSRLRRQLRLQHRLRPRPQDPREDRHHRQPAKPPASPASPPTTRPSSSPTASAAASLVLDRRLHPPLHTASAASFPILPRSHRRRHPPRLLQGLHRLLRRTSGHGHRPRPQTQLPNTTPDRTRKDRPPLDPPRRRPIPRQPRHETRRRRDLRLQLRQQHHLRDRHRNQRSRRRIPHRRTPLPRHRLQPTTPRLGSATSPPTPSESTPSTTASASTSIQVGDGPDALAFSSEGHLVLVANSRSGDVAVIPHHQLLPPGPPQNRSTLHHAPRRQTPQCDCGESLPDAVTPADLAHAAMSKIAKGNPVEAAAFRPPKQLHLRRTALAPCSPYNCDRSPSSFCSLFPQ